MNILYLCDEYPPGRHGGIGTAVKVLGEEMVKKGHTVVVAGFYDWGYGEEDMYESEGVMVYRFRRGLSSNLLYKQDSLFVRAVYKLFTITGIFERDIKRSLKKYKLFLEELISEHNIDIVEIPDYNDYMRFCKDVVLFPKLPVPTIIKAHGGITYFNKEENVSVPKQIWKMEHELLMQADGVCAVSNYTASKTAAYLDYPRPIKTLYNGLPVPAIKNVKKVAKRVIFTGTLIHKKGIDELLQAWNTVHEKMPDAELYIFGKGPVEKLKMLLSEDALKTVFFKGHVPREELYAELGEAMVGVFPSLAESFGLAPLETLICGTAVIYSRLHAGPELIENNVSGILVDPSNINEIAEKIIYLLNNPEVCDNIVRNGRRVVEERFNISVVADENIEYYRTVIAQ